MNLDKKLDALSEIKDCLNDEQFRNNAAAIITKYYVEKLEKTDKYFTRALLLERVNLSLKARGIEQISYSYLRNFYNV